MTKVSSPWWLGMVALACSMPDADGAGPRQQDEGLAARVDVGLAARVEALESALATLSGETSALDTRLDAVETDLSDLDATVGAIDADVSDLGDRVGDLEGGPKPVLVKDAVGQTLGIYVGRCTSAGDCLSVVNDSGYLFGIRIVGEGTQPDAIHFADPGCTGDAMVLHDETFPKTLFYEVPQGRWYRPAGGNGTPAPGSASSHHFGGGSCNETDTTSQIFLRLEVVTPTDVGLPATITPPLVLSLG